MSTIKIPKKLGKCPLVDALIEIRFDSVLDKSVIFGYIYSLINDTYPGRVINLPLSQFPAQVRETDPNLQYKPLYKIEGDDTILQIGNDVICLSSKIPYIGWDLLSKKALAIIKKLCDHGIIKNVSRLGHRYVNFFEGIIDDKLNMNLQFSNNYDISNVLIRSEITDGAFINTLQFSNSAVYKPTSVAQERKGSIIDIDTFKIYSDDYFLGHIKTEIDAAHISEKNLFYSLLKESFINELEPEY